MNPRPPSPYRLKSSTLRFQVPSTNISAWLPDTKFFRVMRQSHTWINIKKFFFAFRTWSRRTIWGDRLFLQFHGPTTILLQTRAARINDVFTDRDVNEVADMSPGTSTMNLLSRKEETKASQGTITAPIPSVQQTKMSTANVKADGTVAFESAEGSGFSKR